MRMFANYYLCQNTKVASKCKLIIVTNCLIVHIYNILQIFIKNSGHTTNVPSNIKRVPQKHNQHNCRIFTHGQRDREGGDMLQRLCRLKCSIEYD